MNKFDLDDNDLSALIGTVPSISDKEVEGFVVTAGTEQKQELAELQKLVALLDKYNIS